MAAALSPGAELESWGIARVNIDDPAWTPALLEELAAGIRQLPPALRAFPGGPLELELHTTPSPHGMGAPDDEAAPSWTGGRRRFHLYRYAPADDPRAAARLSALDDDERERLWRRRAVVHAIIQRWDDALGLSSLERFRELNGWQRPFSRPLVFREKPLNVYPWSYSRAAGQRSASLDLVTFAEELFAPPGSIRAGAVPVDDTVACQELSKARFLREALTARGLLRGGELARPRCPAFEAWARPETARGLELLLVSASGRSPESLFGHLMMRVVRAETERVSSPSAREIVQFVAFTGDGPKGLGYAARGVTGGFRMAVVTTTAGEVTHEMREHEQRTLRRFALNLTPAEVERALERVWELERRGYWDYFFFTDNCAALVVLFLESVLDGVDIELPPRWIPVLPTSALDAIAATRVRGAPLARPLAAHWSSTREVAREAFARRDALARTLRAGLGRADRARLDDAHARLRGPDPAARAAAYGALPPLVTRAAAATWIAYLDASVDVERLAVDLADTAALEVKLAARPASGPGESGPA